MFMRVHYWFHCWGLMNPVSCPTCLSTFHVIFSHNYIISKFCMDLWFLPSLIHVVISSNLFVVETLDEEYKLWCFLLCIILYPSVPSSFLGPNVLLSTQFWNLCYLFGPELNLFNRRDDTWFCCPVYFHISMWKKDGTNYNKNDSKETWL